MKTSLSIEELEDNENSSLFYPIFQDIDFSSKYIILYYTDEVHFQLVGYFNGSVMKTIFTYDELPDKIVDLYKRDMNKS